MLLFLKKKTLLKCMGILFIMLIIWGIKSQLPVQTGFNFFNENMLFTTTTEAEVIATEPENGNKNISLYPSIEITTDQHLISSSVDVINYDTNETIQGEHELNENKIIFKPCCALLPNKNYRVTVNAETANNEIISNYKFNFTTVDMDDKYWVDVKLGEKHTVTVYKGAEKIRHMLASGGRPDSPTPLGKYYTKDKGEYFWSHRFGEGATYWVRLVEQILIHSVPKNHNWQTKLEELAKLGLPASHGCIRLEENDAKWFYENIPEGTLVIIHR